MSSDQALTYIDEWLMPFGVIAPRIKVKDVHADSRFIESGDLFIAIPGKDLLVTSFFNEVIEKGVVAILVDQTCYNTFDADRYSVPIIPMVNLRAQLFVLMSRFYPEVQAQEPTVIGVTGTNGKTTVTQLAAQLCKHFGLKAGVIGTNGVGVLPELAPPVNTTPGLVTLYRYFQTLITKDDIDLISMEVSSHALDQNRVRGVRFTVGVITNISQDHLDYHETMDAYIKAKARLFRANHCEFAVVTIDDVLIRQWVIEKRIEQPTILVGAYQEYSIQAFDSQHKYLLYRNIEPTDPGSRFELVSSWGTYQVDLPLYGDFNVQNVLFACAALVHCYLPLVDLIPFIPSLKPIPGRMEAFYFPYKNITVIVDYAHTPDALERALTTLRKHTDTRVICMFGCGGDRDTGKRPLMGEIASRLSDIAILTNDNPRSEAPESIATDVLAGIPEASVLEDAGKLLIELERPQAVEQAIRLSSPGDIVLLAGKGHETTQVLKHGVVDYDERALVKKLQQQDTGKTE